MNFDLTSENLMIILDCPHCNGKFGIDTKIDSDIIFKGLTNNFKNIPDSVFKVTCPCCGKDVIIDLKKELMDTKKPKKKGLFGKLFGK